MRNITLDSKMSQYSVCGACSKISWAWRSGISAFLSSWQASRSKSSRPELFELVFVSGSIFATCESHSTVPASHDFCCLAPINCPRSARLAPLHCLLRRSVIGRGVALKWEHFLDIRRLRGEERSSLACGFIFNTFLAPETNVTFRVGWATCRDLLDLRLIGEKIFKQRFVAALNCFDFDRVVNDITFERCSCFYLLLRFILS